VSGEKRALGRGLDSLLPGPKATPQGQPTASPDAFLCPLEKIVPQKGQPRRVFDDAKLDELAQSIREHGVLEPLVVRRVAGQADRWELIAGERRWRAAQRAGLRDVLVVVKEASPQHAFELAIIENAQREDLTPIELAEALERLVREYGYTQEALATRLGKDRTTITNSLRLLKLPERVRQMVIDGKLTEGHGRALLGAAQGASIEALAERVVRGGLSVRATEQLVRAGRAKGRGDGPEKPAKSAGVRDLEARLQRSLGTRVEVRDAAGKGELAIAYGSLDELDRILAILER
jgi:ParB family chromosome partitioning protein